MKPLLHQLPDVALEGLLNQTRGSYIFAGQSGVGKFTSSQWLARKLHCLVADPDCRDCQQMELGQHPDIITVQPDEKQTIGIAAVQELQHRLSFARFSDKGRRLAIIDHAQHLTREAQNSLLKLIEEPPVGTSIILVVEDPNQLLITIRSRCQTIYFPPLSDEVVAGFLTANHGVSSMEAAGTARLAGGSVGLAIRLTDEPELAGQYRTATETVDSVAQMSPYQRLLLAGKLAETGSNLEVLLETLVRQLRGKARNTSPDQGLSDSLRAVEAFTKHRGANVNIKSALSGLLLSL